MSGARAQSRYRHALAWIAGALLPLSAAFWSEAAPAGTARPAPKPLLPAVAGRSGAVTAHPAGGKLHYNRDIRPILAENCFACHGPDSAARKADLRLDRPAEATAMRGSRAAIVRGNPAASELVHRISGDGPVMPPAATHKTLTPTQIALLKRWIAEGAEYEVHWAYQVPRRPALPAVKDARWCRNPIDRFVLARLEREGLHPAPEADRRTLARRLSLDLTGLPPDPAEVDRFVMDRAPDAYERLVDRWMATPQWGEHRARFWLDAARYADTHGIHFDNYREMWSYRDWVIRAFNQNMPFDRFTLEQLAGDLLPNATLDQRVASGFNRCNITTNEGGAIAEEYLVLYDRDRTETTSQVWLGTTAGCAVCHDHKFDPLTQREFYSLAAFFNNTTQAAMDGNVKDTAPTIIVPMPEDRARFDSLAGEIAAARKETETRRAAARPDFERWLASPKAREAGGTIPEDGLRLHLPLNEGAGRELSATVDGRPVRLTATSEPAWAAGQISARAFQRRAGSTVELPQAGDFEKDQPFSYGAWVKIPSPNSYGSLIARMDDQHDFRGWDLWVENGRVGTHIVHRWPSDALKVVAREPITAGVWHHVCIAYTGAGNAAGVRIFVDGEAREADTASNSLQNTIRTTVPLKIGQRHSTSGVEGAEIQDVRLYGRALAPEAVTRWAKGSRSAWLVSRPAAQLTDAEREELFGGWLAGTDEPYRAQAARLAALVQEDRMIRLRGTVAHVMQERTQTPSAFVLFRGEYDQRRDPVPPATPAFLPRMSDDLPRNRLGLAKWLLRPENPLTARVTVNRFWQELFGTGLVRTTGDFGVTGEQPSHPELLDWLAVEFREGGWDVKKLFRTLVTSAAYRQSAATTREKRLKDPQDRLLSRGPRFRMDAEMVRDYALAASGLLVRKIGGPSVRPYQPDGVWEAVAMIGSNTRDYRRDTGESLYRRSMYTFWKRAAPPASMEIFNAPTREVCTVRRERTNTPLQALVTMNDPQFVEAARYLAQRALKEGGAADGSRIDWLARRLLARPLRAEEQAVVARSLTDLQAFYNTHSHEAAELIAVGESKADPKLPAQRLAAWTMLANQLLNLDEVLNK